MLAHFLTLVCPLILAQEPSTSSSEAPEVAPAELQTFQRSEVKNYLLRSLGALHILNRRGEIHVQGWSQDKIRIKQVLTVQAKDKEEAEKLWASMQLQYNEGAGKIKVNALYGRGFGMEEKLRERQSPQARMDLVVFAPSRVNLHLWAMDQNSSINNWLGKVQLRSSGGLVELTNVRGGVKLSCLRCEVQASQCEGDLRLMNQQGLIVLKNSKVKRAYLENVKGPIRLFQVRGRQTYVNDGGEIQGTEVSGHLEFFSGDGEVDLNGNRALVYGRSDAGKVTLDFKRWDLDERSHIESGEGQVELTLPSRFSANMEIRALEGEAKVDLPLARLKPVKTEVGQHLRGRVGEGGKSFRITSRKGDVVIKHRRF